MRWHLRGFTAAALARLSRGPFSPRHSLLRDTPPGPCCDRPPGLLSPLPPTHTHTHTSFWRLWPHPRLNPRAGPASHSLKRPRGASPLLELCCPDGGAPTGDMDPPPVSAITGLLAGLVGGDGAPSLGGASCSSAVERLRKEGEVRRHCVYAMHKCMCTCMCMCMCACVHVCMCMCMPCVRRLAAALPTAPYLTPPALQCAHPHTHTHTRPPARPTDRTRPSAQVLRLSELPFYDLAGLLTPLIASSLGAPAASVRSFLHLNEIPEFKPATSKLPSKPATPKVPSPPTPQTTPQPLGSAHSKEQRSGEQRSGEQHSEEQRSGESRRRSPRGLVAPGGPIGGSTPTDPLKGVALPPPEA